MNALTINDLNKSFKDVHVIKDLNLDIKQGEVYGFIAPAIGLAALPPSFFFSSPPILKSNPNLPPPALELEV